MNPSASNLPRVDACPASEALPHAFEAPTVFTDTGHGTHDFILKARVIGRDKALALVPREAPHRQFCEQLPLDDLPQGGRLEVAVAWDSETDTARILFEGSAERDYHRYGIKPTEWVGKIDLLGVAVSYVYVGDYKTGFRSLGPAQESMQLMFGALAATRITGLDDAGLQFLYLKDDGTFWREPWPDPAMVDSLDLAAFAERLRALPGRIEHAREQIKRGETPTVRMGEHCRYCPAKPYCPAKLSLARSMAGEIVSLRSEITRLPVVQQGGLYDRAKEIRRLAEEVMGLIEEQAQVQTIPLPDGYVLKEVPVKWPTKVDAEVAEDVLTEDFGEAVAAAAVKHEKSTTLTAITDALRPISPRGTLATNERRALEAIRARGGLREGTSPGVRRVKG